MIIALIINFLVLSCICVGCDNVAAPIIARQKLTLTRTEIATALCFTIILIAYLIRGVAGLVGVSPLALIGPEYVNLTKTTTAPINLKLLLNQIWENVKQLWKRISGTK